MTLIKPSREEFAALAAQHSVVPVWSELLADLETPVSVFAKLVGDGNGFLFESVEHGERWSRFSFLGQNPIAKMVLRDGVLHTTGKMPAGMVARMTSIGPRPFFNSPVTCEVRCITWL